MCRNFVMLLFVASVRAQQEGECQGATGTCGARADEDVGVGAGDAFLQTKVVREMSSPKVSPDLAELNIAHVSTDVELHIKVKNASAGTGAPTPAPTPFFFKARAFTAFWP